MLDLNRIVYLLLMIESILSQSMMPTALVLSFS